MLGCDEKLYDKNAMDLGQAKPADAPFDMFQ